MTSGIRFRAAQPVRWGRRVHKEERQVSRKPVGLWHSKARPRGKPERCRPGRVQSRILLILALGQERLHRLHNQQQRPFSLPPRLPDQCRQRHNNRPPRLQPLVCRWQPVPSQFLGRGRQAGSRTWKRSSPDAISGWRPLMQKHRVRTKTKPGWRVVLHSRRRCRPPQERRHLFQAPIRRPKHLHRRRRMLQLKPGRHRSQRRPPPLLPQSNRREFPHQRRLRRKAPRPLVVRGMPKIRSGPF